MTSPRPWRRLPDVELLAELDAIGLDAAAFATAPVTAWWGSDGITHLVEHCPRLRRHAHTRPHALVAPLEQLLDSDRLTRCPHCATPDDHGALMVAGRPLAEWRAAALELHQALVNLDRHDDAPDFARTFHQIDRLRHEFAAHPCALIDLAARMLGHPPRPLAGPDHDELARWARRFALAADTAAAPVLPDVSRAELTALGGRAHIDVMFRRWAARRPEHRLAPAWRPWARYWASLADTVELGEPTLVGLRSASYHGWHLGHLESPAGRELYALELTWLRPLGAVRLVPARAAELLRAAAAHSHSTVTIQPASDPSALTVAEHLVSWGVPMDQALPLAAATVSSAPTEQP